ncbi:hypothetical protein HYT84_04270, partial [Candidatus Micrarchaeota archaeon]|nr:hypothetical protein [Candidatus Micrarchaeota archaeon]
MKPKLQITGKGEGQKIKEKMGRGTPLRVLSELRCVKVDKIKFDKTGLIPMIVQDADTGLVLSLFYANREAVEKMQTTNCVWRFSRSKKRVMKKGEKSGNVQKIVSVSLDCDNDVLLVLVSPEGPACHKGTESCFTGPNKSMLSDLVSVIKARKKNPTGSYTSKI